MGKVLDSATENFPAELSDLDSGKGAVWFLCNYCHRGFLVPDNLLTHLADSHRELYFQDKGIPEQGEKGRKRKYERINRRGTSRLGRENKDPAEHERQRRTNKTKEQTDTVIEGVPEQEDGLDQAAEKMETSQPKALPSYRKGLNDINDNVISLTSINGLSEGGQCDDIQILNDDDIPTLEPMNVDSTAGTKDSPPDISGSRSSRHHPSDLDAHLKCTYCSRCFATKSDLKLHQLLFHNIMRTNLPSKCECRYCGKSHYQDSFLAAHEQVCYENMIVRK